MPVNPISDFLHRTAESLSVSESAVLAGAIVMVLLLLFALGVLLQVSLISREKKLTFRSSLSCVGSAMWALPVLAVIAFFAFRVARAQQPEGTAAKPLLVEKKSQEQPIGLRFTSDVQPAEWTSAEPIREKGTKSVKKIVITARGANIDEAERKLAAKAFAIWKTNYPGDVKGMNADSISPATFKRHALARKPEYIRGVESVGDYTNEAVQAYWQLDLSDTHREALREAAASPRLWILGGAVALAALIVIAVAGYFRLDAATQGQYRFRLKLAAASLIVAVGTAVTVLLPMA